MAKTINIVGSKIEYVSIEKSELGVKITVIGEGLDAAGNAYPTNNLFLDWDDLPVNIQNTGDNFFKHVSREFNKLVADEDSEVW